MTACYGCHLDFHSIYGRGRNTEEQWNEFSKSRPRDVDVRFERKHYSVAPGDKYGRLEVIEMVESRRGCSRWLCRCDCGREHEASGGALKQGKVKSCGCLARKSSLGRSV